jgi:non-specific serine/threonine protein kinase
MNRVQVVSEIRARLPMELTSFVGRQHDVDEVARLLQRTRLVTLVGPGGVGKSRLALRILDELASQSKGGVRVIDMGHWGAPTAAPGVLVDSIRGQDVLVLLDDCEHVVSACRELVACLLRAAPSAHIVVTSRIPIELQGEQRWRVTPLPDAEAVQLFGDRLASQQPGFRLTTENATRVSELCRRLDGLPLALELAAAQSALLGVEVVCRSERIAETLLAQPNSGRPVRHSSLRANVDWSESVLSESDQALLVRLTVFTDGFTLAAAEAVCADRPLDPASLLDALERLVWASCLEFDPRPPEGRYRLLNTSRELTRERLPMAERERLIDRLTRWLLRLSEQLDPWSVDPAQLEALDSELGNLRTIFARAETSDRERQLAALQLYVSCTPLWLQRHPGEGLHWLSRMRDPNRSVEDPLLRARTAWLGGAFALRAGDVSEAIRELQAAVQPLAQNGCVTDALAAQYYLGEARRQSGDATGARELFGEVWEMSRAHAHPLAPGVQAQLALALLELGKVEEARQYAGDALKDAQARGHPWSLARAWEATAKVGVHDGDREAAVRAFGLSIAHARKCRDLLAALPASFELAETHLSVDEASRAAEVLQDVLDALAPSEQLPAPHLRRLLTLTAQAVESVRPDQAERFRRAVAELSPASKPIESGQLLTLQNEARIVLDSLQLRAPPVSPLPRPALTARELGVARLVARGLTNRQIALGLSLSEGTVRAHVGHILDKLDLRSRVQVAAWLKQAQPTRSNPLD